MIIMYEKKLQDMLEKIFPGKDDHVIISCYEQYTYDREILVSFSNCEIKEGLSLIKFSGAGDTREDACKEYWYGIQNNLLVFYAYDDDKRKEVFVCSVEE